jgi:hypothetical protein
VNQQPDAVRGVLVVDRRPLERNLVRFILHENGFEVTGEAATPAEALRAIEARPPGVVVLHENAAWEQGQPTIPLLRDALPEAKVLVIAPAFGVVRVELLRDADAVLEEGVGFKDLPFVVGKLSAGEPARAEKPSTSPVVAGAARPRPARERWVNRFQGAAAAAVVFLALVVARAAAPPGPEPVRAEIALVKAEHSLEDLRAASDGSPDALIQQAIELAADRARAISAGADVTALDTEIRTLVVAVIPTLPHDVARTLMWVFSDVPGLTTPAPSATAEPPPSGTESTPPTPSESPAPTEPPVVVASPLPTEVPSPASTQTEPPSPVPTVTVSETATPPPSPSPSETPAPDPTEEPPPTGGPTPTDRPTPTDTPSATPTGSPAPSETETAPPSPSETGTPSPSATDTLSPGPSETGTPSPSTTPSATDSPAPTETPSPAPSQTTSPSDEQAASAADPGQPSDAGVALFLVPPGVGVTATALARRRARRGER